MANIYYYVVIGLLALKKLQYSIHPATSFRRQYKKREQRSET